MKKEKQWIAEERSFASIANAFVDDKSIKVHGINPESNDLGYTFPDEKQPQKIAHIYVCRYNTHYMSDLDEGKQSLFRMGIFVHETLHQVYTDFDNTLLIINKIKNKSSESKAKLFKLIANIVEDSRIESFAHNVFGGMTLTSLRFSIREIFNKSPKIDEIIPPSTTSPTPLNQVINALVMIGDVGYIKGKFLSPKAEEVFYRVLPIFEEGASQKTGLACLRKAEEITDILAEEFADELPEMKFDVSNNYSGKGHGKPMEGEGDSEASERRKALIKKSSETKGSPSSSSSVKGGSPSSKTSKSDSSESPTPEESSTDSGSSSLDDFFDEVEVVDEEDSPEEDLFGDSKGSDEDLDSEEDLKGDGKDGVGDVEGENEDDESSEDSSPLDKPSSSDTSDTSDSSGDFSSSTPEIEWRDDDEYEGVSEEELKKALEALETSIAEETKKLDKETSDESCLTDIDDVKVKDNFVKNIVNFRVKEQRKEAYNQIVANHNSVISALTRNVRNILEKRKEEDERKTSGKLNIKRYSSPNYTGSRVFDKKSNSAVDTCLFLLVDESGSMGGDKENCARNSAVILAEMAYNLHMPVYVMGFSGDQHYTRSGEHYHYVAWKNSKGDRYTIPNICARYQNRDGLAIRTATEILKKRPESEKILLVLSDGEPWAGDYCGSYAIADTKNAVREAKNVCKVLGIAIGTASTDKIHNIYQNDFMLCSNPSELKFKLLPALKRLLNK